MGSSGEATIRFGAQVGDLLTALDRVGDSAAQSEQFFRRYKDSINAFDGQLSKLINTLDPAAGDLQRLAVAEQQLDNALKLGMVSAAQHADLMGKARDIYGNAAEGAERYASTTVGARREMMVLAHEAVSGNFSRIPGSMMVLAERTDGVSGAFKALAGAIFSPTGAVIGLGLAFAGMLVHAEHVDREMAAMRSAFAATGDAARFNRDEMEHLVHQMALMPGITRSSAEEIITGFARTRQIGGALFAQLTGIVSDFAVATGKEAPQAAQVLAKAFANPAQGAKSLDDALGILTAAQLRSIESFSRQGRVAEAQQVLFDALNARIKNLAQEGLTDLQRSSDNMERAWDRLTHTLSDASWIRKTKEIVGEFFDMTSAVISPSAEERYVQALNRFGEANRKLSLSESSFAKDPSDLNRRRIDGWREAVEKTRVALEEAGRAAGHISYTPESQPKPAIGGDSADDIKKRANALDKYKGIQEKSREIDEEIRQLHDAAAVSTGRELANFRERIATAEKAKADLVKPQGGETALQGMQAELDKRHLMETHSAQEWLAIDRDFWRAKLANATAGTAEYDQIQRRLVTAQNALTKEAVSRDRDMRREQLSTDAELARIRIQTERDRLDAEVQAGRMTEIQKVDALRKLVDEEYLLGDQRLQAEVKLLTEGTVEYQKALDQRTILKAKHDADLAKMDDLAARARKKQADDTARDYERMLSPINNAISTSIQGMIMGTQTLRHAVARLGQSILASIFDTCAKALTKWVSTEIAKTTATATANTARTASTATATATQTAAVTGAEAAQTGAVVSGVATRTAAEATGAATEKAAKASSIMVKAGDAAASVYDEVAQIPYVGWILAPAAAAAAFTAVAGYSMFSAEGGWDRVPYDGAQTILHKDEMVLPARIANPLRNLAETGMPALSYPTRAIAANVNLPGPASATTGSAAPLIVNYSPVIGDVYDAGGFARILDKHKADIARAVHSAHRAGVRPR